MQKISEWLSELGTHTILDCAKAKEDFTKETGEPAPWGDGYTQPEMQAQIDGRGKGGDCHAKEGVKLIGSLDVASACYDKFRGSEEAAGKFGMGSQFREYVDAIKRNEALAA